MEKVTKQQLFQMYAPAFNFELDADEIIQELYKAGILLRYEGQEDLYSLATNVEV